MEEKESVRNYLLYAITFVAILIIATFAATYAYYKVSVSASNTLVNVSASLECVDLSLSDSGTSIGLSYNYPITDELALQSGSVTPVTVTVTNNCSTPMNYTLALSTLALTDSSSNYIEDSKIRYRVLKNNVVFKSADYLSSLSAVSSDNQAYKDLTGTNGELAVKYPKYTVKKIYAIENVQTIEANKSNTYNIYLWVDYYEGDFAMYSTSDATHNTDYDGTTQDKKFSAAISLSLNP